MIRLIGERFGGITQPDELPPHYTTGPQPPGNLGYDGRYKEESTNSADNQSETAEL